MVKQKDAPVAVEDPKARDAIAAVSIIPAPTVRPEAEEAVGETPDSVELYLNEIARYKLLRPEEEVQLAKEMETGASLTN